MPRSETLARAAAGAKPPSARHRAAALANLEKAWEANRTHWEKTPARMANARRTIRLAHAALRRRPRKFSPAQLAAPRANMAQARATLNARRRSPEHLARLRETIKRARAARTTASLRLQAEKVLKHGMYASDVRRTMRSLGEDPRGHSRRLALLRRFLASRGESDERMTRALADALWRRERLYYAQAEWESQEVDGLLAGVDTIENSSPALLRARAYQLLAVLLGRDRYFDRDRHMLGSIERLLRRLLRQRFGRDPQFQTSLRLSFKDDWNVLDEIPGS